ncbi:MAG: aspartate-semialdehyde dehydrogenase [Deltaproteobacteria bacterium]|nr:aspartate-semialdehyde dehydrogenase [Deltaproteobacteria bacterium]
MQEKRYTVAVLGATGAVGREMLRVLDELRFPATEVLALASPRSVGETVDFGARSLDVQVAEPKAFDGVDIVLASAGSAVSKALLPEAARRGALCIDNSSAFRMHADVPLVVPEVNPTALIGHKGIVANPNCSTIQMVVALKPLHDLAGLRRVVVSTYQSVSGAGQKGIEELAQQTAALLNGKPFDIAVHNARIAFNVIPHIGSPAEGGYTEEELKLVHETRKIMGLPDLAVCPTAVRVPVTCGHSESVVAEFDRPITVAQAREALASAHGVVVVDDLANKRYPMPMDCAETDPVYVGRIRRDPSVPHGLALWVVADNLRKGAATNAVQIAKLAVAGGLVHGA